MTDDVADARVEHSVVVAARAGDRRALEELVAAHLPLVYSIVGRTLSSDVDDVVQDTMVRVVRGIGGLQQPDSFRSWLVAVTVNQIREHRKRRSAVEGQWEQYGEHPDPNAEFADYALLRLDVARQQQEVERAARWLQPGDRDLLSLWILESSGHLTRADIARALNLDPHHATVRVSRLKGRLEGARMVVRALSARPRRRPPPPCCRQRRHRRHPHGPPRQPHLHRSRPRQRPRRPRRRPRQRPRSSPRPVG